MEVILLLWQSIYIDPVDLRISFFARLIRKKYFKEIFLFPL